MSVAVRSNANMVNAVILGCLSAKSWMSRKDLTDIVKVEVKRLELQSAIDKESYRIRNFESLPLQKKFSRGLDMVVMLACIGLRQVGKLEKNGGRGKEECKYRLVPVKTKK